MSGGRGPSKHEAVRDSAGTQAAVGWDARETAVPATGASGQPATRCGASAMDKLVLMAPRAGVALGVCALLAAFGVLTLWVRNREEPTAATPAPAASVEVPPRADGVLALPSGEAAERERIEDGRGAVASSANPAGRSLESTRNEALLRVRVLAQGSEQPMAGVRVLLQDQDFHRERKSSPRLNVDRARARPGEAPRTGEDGWVEFLVPEGKRWSVLAMDKEGAWLHSPMLTWTPVLAHGETHELVLRIAPPEELVFFGRVVAAEDRAPLAGAEVALDSPSGEQARALTGPDGIFQLRGRGFARAQADGFAPAIFHLSGGHERAADAFEVLLQRAAGLVARVRDRSGTPIPGARVTLRTSQVHMILPETLHLFGRLELPVHPSWTKKTDGDGRCSIEDLPPSVPLALELHVEGSPPPAASHLVLEAGEVRELDLVAGGGIELRGQLVDQREDPVTHQRVVLARPEPPFEFQVLMKAGTRAVAEAMTDGQGWFTMPDVSPGSWLIGPAPAPLFDGSTRGEERGEAERVVPLAVPIEVGTRSPHEVLLRVDRGVYIRGRVVDSKGDSTNGSVRAVPDPKSFLKAAFTADVVRGSFSLGPLPSGHFHVTAVGGVFDAKSDTVLVEAGQEDVRLRLGVGGRVEGQVVDAGTGAPRAASVSISPAGEVGMIVSPFKTAGFRFEGLSPGTYALFARDGDAVGWLAGVDLGPGEERTGLRVPLERGAGLRVWNRSPRWGSFQVRFDGYWIDARGVDAGSVAGLVLPPGRAEIRLDHGESERTVALDLAAGVVQELSFEEDRR